MTDHLAQAYSFDISMRSQDDKAPIEESKIITTEITEGVVYEQSGLKVITFLVDYYPVVPAFKYRIEYGGHSVTISGDTKFSANLIRFAKGTDLLVHEVVIARNTKSKSHHTTLEQAGKIFSIVGPKLPVYSHIVNLYGSTNEELIRRTKTYYSGPVIVGDDLMSFLVRETISVKEWK